MEERRMTGLRPVVIHKHPSECLPFFAFEYSDGGRADYFSNLLKSEQPREIQDCSVIAASLAFSYNSSYESPMHSYLNALSGLRMFNSRRKPWKSRQSYESAIGHWFRKVRQFWSEFTARGLAKHQNPIYGTDSEVYGAYLEGSGGYAFVYEELRAMGSFCLCNAAGTLVVDGYFEKGIGYDGGNAHVTAIINHVITGPTDISNGKFHVLHVWRRV